VLIKSKAKLLLIESSSGSPIRGILACQRPLDIGSSAREASGNY
jgi:hypothetical protein